MTIEQSRRLRDKAEEKRAAGDYLTAGDYYSRAAFERTGRGAFLHFSTGFELRRFLEACTCYRVGGADQWCENRARMGALLAKELGERVFSNPEPEHAFDRAQRGVWYEYVGDFRTVGQFDDSEAAYERTKETYRDAGDPRTGAAEQPQGAIMAYFYTVADAAGADMDEVYETTKHQPFSEWVEYKQKRLPGLLETLVENGSYPL